MPGVKCMHGSKRHFYTASAFAGKYSRDVAAEQMDCEKKDQNPLA